MIRRTLLALSFAGLTFAGGQALAGPVDPFLVGGLNTLQDKSGELVFRCLDTAPAQGSRCTQLAPGDAIQNAPGSEVAGTFDVVAGILDFEDVNGTNIALTGNQLSGVFATKLDGLDGANNNIVMQSAVGANVFAEIFGIDLNAIVITSGTADNIVGLFYQHNAVTTNPQLVGGDFASALAAAQNGTLAAAVGLVDDDDFFEATINNPNSAIVGGGTAGNQTVLLNLAFALTFQAFNFSGDFVSDAVLVDRNSDGSQSMADLGGSGSITKPGGQNVSGNFHFGNDIQAQFVRIPEPTTVGLLGLGLLGFGAMARRRRRTA